MKYFFLFLTVFLFSWQWSSPLPPPEKDHIEVFFQRLIQDGGNWEADNPAAESSGFSRFRMEFTADSQFSIRGMIKGIKADGDTLLFWDLWEFPDPSQQNTTVLVQRSGSAYAIGRSRFLSDDQREGESEFTFYNNSKQKHRDEHHFMSRDTIVSTSSNYDAERQEWGAATRLIWVRQ